MANEQTIGSIVVGWHRSTLNQDDGAARATRARLKRCESPIEALAVEATHDLNKQLRNLGEYPDADVLALLATVFARLKGTEGGDELAALFGKKRSGKDEARFLSELRFQSLIRIRSHRDLITPLRRSLAVLGSDPTCNGWKLAEDLYFWNRRVHNKWCFQYFGSELPESTK